MDSAAISFRREVPKTFSLSQNYPNPFNPSTAISYQLSAVSPVELKVYDLLGREVATLVDEIQEAGHKEVVWNGRNDSGAGVAGGIYVYRMMTDGFIDAKRTLLLK